MAYDDFEVARFGSRAVELLEFFTPPNTPVAAGQYRLTSSEVLLSLSGNNYSPVEGVDRQRPQSGNSASNGEMTMNVPHDFPLLELWAQGRPPLSTIQMLVKRAHIPLGVPIPEDPATPLVIDPTNVITRWRGFVGDASFTPNGADLLCMSVGAALNKTGLRHTYQGTCNNILYDENCRVDIANPAFFFSGTMARVGDPPQPNLITVAGLNDNPNTPVQFFKAGHILHVPSGQQITISINPDGSLITFQEIPDSWATGDAVTVHGGCMHRYSICEITYQNGRNFGGYHLIPETDPHIRVSSNSA